MTYNPTNSPLAGMSNADVQAALNAAQKGYVELMTGQRGVHFSYAQGDGVKTVYYDKVDQQTLLHFIDMCKAQLGMPTRRRRALGIRY